RSAVTWTLDGARLADGPLLPPLPLEIGHELACIITPSDGVATATRQVVTRHVESELRGNVLIVLLDDIGAYDLQLYDPTATFVTPRLDALAAEGLTFNRAWSTPFCAPTRAAAMTGRYPLRTGLGTNFRVDEPEASLPDAEVTWAEHVRATVAAPYRFAAVGKWHLATWPDGGGARVLDQGFDTYLGALGNLYDTQSIDGLPMDYFDWEKYDDAHVSRRQGYVTIDEAEDAIRLMREMPEPWVLWVATHAAHEPFAEPPLDALPWGPTTIAESGNRAKYAHMIEAVDAQIGNMVDAAPADTHIFVLADNGVPEVVADPSIPDNRMKGSVFEGGVRVPMIVRSPYVATPGARTDALAHVVDLFPTIVELAGGSTAGLDIDGRSLVDVLNDPSSPGPHPVIYTERFEPNGFGPYTRYDRAIRDASYKVVRLQDGVDRLYRLDGDLAEGVDLRTFALTPQEQAAYAALAGRLDRGDLR
ncbi:MAG TPA: sulfatase-like hydrolase/transferase, partial [Myxococcota bacterium]|nr:sulfatase-like hydrolase/transferase [Myxococcota bacterium]